MLNDVSSAQVFELPELKDTMVAKVMPQPWRQYWQHQNKTPTQRVSAAFTAASPRVYTGQTEQCTERYMASGVSTSASIGQGSGGRRRFVVDAFVPRVLGTLPDLG